MSISEDISNPDEPQALPAAEQVSPLQKESAQKESTGDEASYSQVVTPFTGTPVTLTPLSETPLRETPCALTPSGEKNRDKKKSLKRKNNEQGLLSLNAVFVVTERSESFKAALPSQAHRVLKHVDGRATVAQILKASPYSIERTMQVIRRLHSVGAIEALNQNVLLKKNSLKGIKRSQNTPSFARVGDALGEASKNNAVKPKRPRAAVKHSSVKLGSAKQGLLSGALPKKSSLAHGSDALHNTSKLRSDIKTTPIQDSHEFEIDKRSKRGHRKSSGLSDSSKGLLPNWAPDLAPKLASTLEQKTVVSGIFDEILKDKPTVTTFAKVNAPSAIPKAAVSKVAIPNFRENKKQSTPSNKSAKSKIAREANLKAKDGFSNDSNWTTRQSTVGFGDVGQEGKKPEDTFIDLTVEDIEQIVVDSFMTPTASGLVDSNASKAKGSKPLSRKTVSHPSEAVYTPLDESDIIGFEPDTLPEGEGLKPKLIVKEFNQKSVVKALVAPDLKDEPSIVVDEDSLAPEDSLFADDGFVDDGIVETVEGETGLADSEESLDKSVDLEGTDPSLELDVVFESSDDILGKSNPLSHQKLRASSQPKDSIFTKEEEEFFDKADQKPKATDFNFEDLDRGLKAPMTFWERLKQKRS